MAPYKFILFYLKKKGVWDHMVYPPCWRRFCLEQTMYADQSS
jgi:hypothetical protein